MSLSREIAALRKLSARVGRDLELTQGAGGNTSVKVDGILWVKASGKWLRAAEEEEIFLPVDWQRVRRTIPVECSDPGAETPLIETPLRASIETSFHAFLPQKVVVHLHSVNAIPWAVQRQGEARLRDLLVGLEWRWVPYVRPGMPLTRLMASMFSEDVTVWILANHGLIVAADTVSECEALLGEVERRIAIAPRLERCDLQRLAQHTSREWKLPKHEIAHQAAATAERVALAVEGSMYPDNTVFVGPACAAIKASESVAQATLRFEQCWHMQPKALLVEGAGLLIRQDANAGVEEMAGCLGLVLSRISDGGQCVFLDRDEIYGLMNWDAEKYRQQIAAD